MEHQFNEGEKILCFEPMLGRSRVLYEAKVTGLVRRRTREPSYRLNIFEWNKIYKDRNKKCSYDHDVAESFVIKINQRTQKLMHKLTIAAQNITNEVERAEAISQMILKAYNEKKIKHLPPGLELDDDKLDSPEDNLTLEQVKNSLLEKEHGGQVTSASVDDEYRVEIELADELREILEHECAQIKTYNKLPDYRGPNVQDILEMFLRHYANMLLYEKPKHYKDSYKVDHRLSLTKEVLEGIRCLFDTILSTNLLYDEEALIHDKRLSGQEVKLTMQAPTNTSCGAGIVSRRQTRSSVTEPSTNISQSPHLSSQLQAGGPGGVDDSQNDGPCAKKSRHVPNLLQTIQLQNPTSGRSTPVLHNTQAEALMKEINDWRLVPHDISPPLPSFKYGANHLLRLFVQLPDILTRMKLSDERRSFLLSVINPLLNYLLEERQTLFDSIQYMYLASASQGDTTSVTASTDPSLT